MDTPKEIADMINAKGELGLSGGVLITNPIPTEYEMDPVVINKAINEAIVDSPELLNDENHADKWLIKIETNADQIEFADLLDYSDYKEEIE